MNKELVDLMMATLNSMKNVIEIHSEQISILEKTINLMNTPKFPDNRFVKKSLSKVTL